MGANGHDIGAKNRFFLTARRKLDQVENGNYDKEVSSMGSRSSSSGKKTNGFSCYLVIDYKKKSHFCFERY